MRKQKEMEMVFWVARLLRVQLRNSFRNEAKRKSSLQKSIDTTISDRHAVHTVASVICASDQNLDEFAHLFEDTA